MTEQAELMLANTDETPVFKGVEFDEHVESWRQVNDSLEGHLWMLGAIASSFTTNYGSDDVGRFAYEVACSKRYVWQLSKTYEAYNDENCTRVQNLSFKHHTVAARSAEPQKALEQAHDNGWSTRELEDVVKAEKPKGSAKYKKNRKAEKPQEGDDVEETTETMVLCPCCEGHGVVPASSAKSIAKAIKNLAVFRKVSR